ncbi:hypothetical protein CCM_02856 [Cordyceps militaris CM01]|uniref:Uncharacterized protein n=1 Tax=Cordyceps militaris (strain CM01) TaxID=983644 RepID=G3JC70_CORMM|nr:uncharacterized protein CCM_02856 [Cordyceps militaris CM01]EGX94585.1 hypothetical protein CCM_02856 [Cordyceps militaris CM01]
MASSAPVGHHGVQRISDQASARLEASSSTTRYILGLSARGGTKQLASLGDFWLLLFGYDHGVVSRGLDAFPRVAGRSNTHEYA